MRASAGERKIHDILVENGFQFVEEYSFPDLVGSHGVPLRFDFAVFEDDELLCLIEYQGRQHYEPCQHFGGRNSFNRRQRYDLRKQVYCKRNGINLVTVPYTDEARLSYDYLVNAIDR